MPVIPNSSFAQVNYVFSNDSNPNPAEITLGLGGDFSDGATVTDFLAGAFADRILPFLSDNIALVATRLKVGPNSTGPSFENTVVTEGGDTGLAVPANTSILVRKVTASGGRAGRGRWYLPGLRESRVDSGGNIDGTYVSDLGAALDLYFDDLEGADLIPEVLHGAGSPIGTPTPITSFQVQSRAATQRRRMRH